MSSNVWTPLLKRNPSLRNKSLRAGSKIARVELLRGLCRDMLWKKSKALKIITTTFGKSLFLTHYRMRYAIYLPTNTKDLVINLTMVAYGNRQNAITFTRANNSDLLRALKQLIETRLKKQRIIRQNIIKNAPVERNWMLLCFFLFWQLSDIDKI